MFDPEKFSQGATLPAVELADLTKFLELVAEYAKRAEESGQLSAHAAGLGAFKMAASPGADVGAAWFRAVLLHFALKHGKFTNFQDQGELGEDFLRLWASFPFRAVGTKPSGEFSLNESESMKRYVSCRALPGHEVKRGTRSLPRSVVVEKSPSR